MHRLPAHSTEGPDAADVEAMLLANAVETVIVAGLDGNGLLRGKRVPARGIAAVLEHGVGMCDVLWALPVDEAAPVPPPPETGDLYLRDDLDGLPRTLDAAADRLERSELARDWLGPDLVAQHVAMSRAESAAAAAAVTDWETARYLEVR